ncbi:MAG: site-2 protease family protein, partial [Anaerolineae bacterium]|nr:site-2 protease family protein [Anaerolineae bacterium]
LIFAIPILIAGIATAEINHLPTTEDCREDGICDYLLEGNSIVYAVAKYVIHGKWLPNDIEDMTINQLSFAGWTGLFVTGLNLLPVGQLDGGHILYTLVGRTARRLYVPAMIVMGLLALNNSSWLLWVMLLFFFGRIHAVPMDDITPLDSRRRTLGIIALVVFFLIFTPSPFEIISVR